MTEDASSQEDNGSLRGARRASLALWLRLTQPHPSIRKPERRRARLLSALLLALIPLGFLAIALTVSSGPALLFVPIAAVVLLCCAYGLSRTQNYTLAATLTVATVGGSVIAVSIANPNSPVLDFMVLAVLLSSLLLSLRATVFVFGAAVAADVILRALLPGLPPPQFLSALYDLVTIGALLILAAAVRQRDLEHIERQNQKLSQEVAERKQTEAALHESEERYRSLAEAAPDMVFIIGRDDRVEYVNRAAATQFGVGPEEVIGRPRESLFPPQIAEAQKQSLQQVFAGGQAARRETAAVFRDQLVWLDTSLVPLLDEAGSVRAVLGIARDITDRKQAERQLRLITTALEATANGVVITDPTGATLWVNPAFTTLTGYTSAEALGKNPRDLVKSGQHSREFYRALWQTIASGRPWQGEMINRRKDGSLYAEEQTITPVRNERGEITHFIAIKVDSSDRKRREEALRQSEERFLSAFESAAIGMALVAPDGHWLKVNRVLCDIVGYSAQDLMAKTFQDITHPDDLTTDLNYVRQLLAGEIRTYQMEKRYFHKSGRVVWVLLSVSLVRDHGGHPVHFISQIQDITERKRGDLLREVLFHIAQAAVATESLDDLYRSIHAALADLIHVENFYIALYDAAGDQLSFPYFVDQVDQPDPPKKPGRGLTEYVLRTGRTLLADPDTFEHLVRQGEVELIGAPAVDWLGVPLKVEDRLAGVMVVQSYTEGVRFTPADAQVLEFVSSQVAGAIERKRTEAAVRDANQFSHEVISSAAEGIIVYDREMRYLVWNHFMGDLTGLPAEQVLGKRAFDLFPHLRESGIDALLDRALSGEVVVSPDTPYRIPQTGKSGWTLGTYAPHRNADGEIVGVIGTVRDITERRQAEESLRARSAELAALFSLSTRLREAHTADEILPIALREARQLLNADSGMVLLLNQPDGCFTVAVADGLLAPNVGLTFQPEEGLSEAVSRTRRPIVTADYAAEPRRLARLQHGDEIGPAAIVPLQSEIELLGVLGLTRPRADAAQPFSAGDVSLLAAIGEMVGNALRRARLFDDADRRLHQTQALRNIDMAITAGTDLRMTLGTVLQEVTSQLGVDAADILLLNQHTMTLEFSAGRGFRSRAVERTRLRLGEGQAGRAALERRTIQHPDFAASGAAFAQADLLAGEAVASYFAVPLVAKAMVKGVLEIFHRSPLYPDPEWLNFLASLAGQAAIAIENATLFDGLQRTHIQLSLAYDATIEGWSRALELRDRETEGHTLRVTEMTMALARAVGISDEQKVHVRRGALLHDIGKMGVPDSILLKAGPLTDDEWRMMRLHPQLAYDMLSPIAYLKPALDIPFCHHERWDGAGYPRGLKGEQIPLAARVFALADVWDALRSDRPYRAAWPEEKVREYIHSLRGTHFDPQVVDAFLDIM